MKNTHVEQYLVLFWIFHKDIFLFFFGFQSTLLARQLHHERTQMEAQ